MKTSKSINNVKLGLFVMAGSLFLILSLYMIGRNRNLFGPTFTIAASFRNINGLMVGNNVRFSGIDVGTVSKIRITSDSSVMVEMVIDKNVRKFIKDNAIAAIGTDGLMGNKLVNINFKSGTGNALKNGSILQSEPPIETDEMLRTLNQTNENMQAITVNLKEMAERLNQSSSLWTILGDTQITVNLKSAAFHLDATLRNAETLTADVKDMTSVIKEGNGLVQALLMDTTLKASLEESVTNVGQASKNLSVASAELNATIATLNTSKGLAGLLLSDSVSSRRLQQSILSVEEGTSKFNRNMEAMQHNFLFRKYFRKESTRDSIQ
jgi:phospholipid/cholesterol/gamma-HCH transport system substrate-binding protein